MAHISIRALFADPGYSLLRSPFGSRKCYFLGVFYPCNPTQALISVQDDVLAKLRFGGAALMFEADRVESAKLVDGDIADAVNRKILDTDQLFDINIYFERTASGICVSQEESLVLCASIDSECDAYLDAIVRKFASDISGSVEPIKNHVKLLSGTIPPYFS